MKRNLSGITAGHWSFCQNVYWYFLSGALLLLIYTVTQKRILLSITLPNV